MPQSYLLDSCVVGVVTLVTAASSALLAVMPQSAVERMDLMFLLLPLIGAVCASGGFIMLNPRPEERRVTIGRGLLALFFGTISPQVVSWLWPSLAEYNVKPVFLLLVGSVVSALVFVLIKPIAVQLFKRSDGIADALVDRTVGKFPGGDSAEKPTQKL